MIEFLEWITQPSNGLDFLVITGLILFMITWSATSIIKAWRGKDD